MFLIEIETQPIGGTLTTPNTQYKITDTSTDRQDSGANSKYLYIQMNGVVLYNSTLVDLNTDEFIADITTDWQSSNATVGIYIWVIYYNTVTGQQTQRNFTYLAPNTLNLRDSVI